MLAIYDISVDKCGEMTHVWVIDEEGFKIAESPNHNKFHEDVWGSEVNENPVRGYVYEHYGVVTCHHDNGINKKTIRKLERELDKLGIVVFKYRGKVADSLVEV